MSSMMNALRLCKIDGPGGHKTEVQLVRVAIPKPSQGEVLIKVHASALNPSDILNAKGGFPYTTFTYGSRTLGRDYAGTVVDAPGHAHLIGINVYGTSGNILGFTQDGTHAEFLVLPCDAVAEMPKNLAFNQAGSLGVVYTTAMTMLEKARLSDYMQTETLSVLIVGGRGNVGTALQKLVQATRPDANIFVANREDGKMEFLPEKTYDVIFFTVPDTPTLQVCTTLLAKHSKLVFIACTRGTAGLQINIDPLKFYRDQLSLIGVNSVLPTLQEVKVLMDNLSVLIEKEKIFPGGEHAPKIAGLTTGVEHYRAATTQLTFSMVENDSQE